jgi:hypothetical protein
MEKGNKKGGGGGQVESGRGTSTELKVVVELSIEEMGKAGDLEE